MATTSNCGPLPLLSPDVKFLGPLYGSGCIATKPSCGPLLILSL